MLSSLYSGISGLLANSDALDVISNNISNVNTVGYKSQAAQFEDLLYQTIVGASGTSQVGRGAALESVNTDFSQGSFETTNSSHRPRHRRAGVLHREEARQMILRTIRGRAASRSTRTATWSTARAITSRERASTSRQARPTA